MRTLSIVTALALLLAAVPFTGHADEESPIHLNATFEDTDVRHVIAFIAKAAHANVIVSPGVKGTITLRLKSVPWRAALEQVVSTVGGAVIEEKSGILRVLAKGEFDTFTVGDKRIHVPRYAKITKERLKGGTLDELTSYAGRRNALDELAKRRAEMDQHEQALAALEKARAEAAAKAAELERQVAGIRKVYEVLEGTHAFGKDDEDWKRQLRLAAARIKEAEALLAQQTGGRPATAKKHENLSKQILEWKVFSDHIRGQVADRGEKGPTREQRSAIGRLDEGSRRLLESLHAERARVAGRIVDRDGKPVAGTVYLGKKTDADGWFELGGTHPVTAFEWEKAAGGPVVWVGKDGQKRRALLIGKEGKDGRVIYEVVDAENGHTYMALDLGKKTDGVTQGHYVVHGLKAGTYTIEMKKDPKGRYVVRTKPAEKDTVVWKESIGYAGGAGSATRTRTGSRTVRAKAKATKEAQAVIAEREEKRRRVLELEPKHPSAAAARALKRAQDLEAAAKHLRAAGDEQGASNLYRRAREAYEAAKRQGEDRDGEAGLLHAVNALRRDVHQLRGEVRELTDLVRQLIGQRRPPAAIGLPGSGGRGGAFTGRAR